MLFEKGTYKEDSYKRSIFITFRGNETMVWFVDLGFCAVQKKKKMILYVKIRFVFLIGP